MSDQSELLETGCIPEGIKGGKGRAEESAGPAFDGRKTADNGQGEIHER